MLLWYYLRYISILFLLFLYGNTAKIIWMIKHQIKCCAQQRHLFVFTVWFWSGAEVECLVEKHIMFLEYVQWRYGTFKSVLPKYLHCLFVLLIVEHSLESSLEHGVQSTAFCIFRKQTIYDLSSFCSNTIY